MGKQAAAILWAQWRTLRNYYPRASKGGMVFTIAITSLWYGMWTFGAYSIFLLTSDPASKPLLEKFLAGGLLLAVLYWQVVPIALVSTGLSLDLKRLVVYPVPTRQLFGIEVMLRVTTAIEMALMTLGAAIGLWRNPSLPSWAALPLAPFVLMNLLFSAGMRDLLSRAFARKGVREAAVLLLVLATALPQVLLTMSPKPVQRLTNWIPQHIWPWTAAARLAVGAGGAADAAVLLAWTAAAYAFGRWQFGRGLRFDAEAARATQMPTRRSRGIADQLYAIPRILFRDPLAALVEKELRVLSRAPRFRLVFLMGFTFGLLIWLPILFGRESGPDSVMANNYLTFVSVYALMLLGEVTIWNVFGFDRSAAQAYFAMPLPFSTVLIAKNIAALFFVVLNITLVIGVCALVRAPMTPAKVVEAYAVSLVFALYLVAAGNMASLHNPRPVNAAQSWRSNSAGKFQAMLLIVYPVLAIPLMLAYGARYAFESNIAFYAALAFAAVLGLVVYWVAMDSALGLAAGRKEQILTALSSGENPVG